MGGAAFQASSSGGREEPCRTAASSGLGISLDKGTGPSTSPFRPFLKARIEVLTRSGVFFPLSVDIQTKRLFLVLVVVFFVNFSPMFLALRCQLLFLAM